MLLSKKETIQQQIVDKVMADCNSVMTKKEASDRIEYILCMLTNVQKLSLLNKVKRCNYYINLLNKGMDIVRIKGVIRRRFQIQRQHIKNTCEPCESYVSTKLK